MMEENVVSALDKSPAVRDPSLRDGLAAATCQGSAAGTTYRLNEPQIRALIADAGWRPQKRNYCYQPL
jgi:hypothetical protein